MVFCKLRADSGKALRLVGGRLLSPKSSPLSYPAKWLIIPMGLLALLGIVGSLFTDGVVQNLLIELSVTFFGVLVTVFYVDRVLSRHEKQRWAGTRDPVTTTIKRIST